MNEIEIIVYCLYTHFYTLTVCEAHGDFDPDPVAAEKHKDYIHQVGIDMLKIQHVKTAGGIPNSPPKSVKILDSRVKRRNIKVADMDDG